MSFGSGPRALPADGAVMPLSASFAWAPQGTVQVTGNVTAKRRLTLGGSGKLHGDVRVGRLTVEDGATLNGNVTMAPEKG